MIAAIIIIVLIVFIIFTFDESDNKEVTWLNAKVKELEEENLNLERQLKNEVFEVNYLRRMLSVYEEYERFKLKRDEKSNKDS
jgi:cell division protein FtsL